MGLCTVFFVLQLNMVQLPVRSGAFSGRYSREREIIISCAFCKKTTTFSEYPLDKIQLNVKENLCNCLLTDALHRLLSYFTVSKCSRPWEAVLLCHRPRRCRSGSLLVCSLISSASFGVSVSSWYSFPHARRTIKNLNSAS